MRGDVGTEWTDSNYLLNEKKKKFLKVKIKYLDRTYERASRTELAVGVA